MRKKLDLSRKESPSDLGWIGHRQTRHWFDKTGLINRQEILKNRYKTAMTQQKSVVPERHGFKMEVSMLSSIRCFFSFS